MFQLALIINLFLLRQIAADSISYVDYGGKIPQYEKFDVRFNYDADGNRDCEVALKNVANTITYAYAKVQCYYGRGAVRAVTLKSDITPATGVGYAIEIKIINNGAQTAYYSVNVVVEAGKQGFHIYDGKLYDANSNEFIIRGINNAHADYDNYDRWWAFNALKPISETGANTVRILWRKYSVGLTNLDLDRVIGEAISKNLVPMIEMHDATGSSDNNKLYEMAQWLADNVWLLIKYRKYLLVNIANEWSPWGTSETYWRDSYKYAISIIRNAGYSGTLVIDASAYAQNPNGPKLYGNELLSYDPAYNLLFSIHMYAEWSNEQPNYNIVNELAQLKAEKVPLIIGEFANKHPTQINWSCVDANIDAKTIMSECKRHGFGYLGWSWAGNGWDSCCILSYLDISRQWNDHDYSEWGLQLIFYPNIGIKDTSKRATIFN